VESSRGRAAKQLQRTEHHRHRRANIVASSGREKGETATSPCFAESAVHIARAAGALADSAPPWRARQRLVPN